MSACKVSMTAAEYQQHSEALAAAYEALDGLVGRLYTAVPLSHRVVRKAEKARAAVQALKARNGMIATTRATIGSR